MKIFITAPIPCAKRRIKLLQYRDFLMENGHEIVDEIDNCNYILLWTCAFRQDYRDNSLAIIDDYEKHMPGKLIVAGCLPDIDPIALKQRNIEKIINWKDDAAILEKMFQETSTTLKDIQLNVLEPKLIDNLESARRKDPDANISFSDQFVKLLISEGCRQECTYCSERLMFPEYRSFPIDDLIRDAKINVEKNKQYEIMLHADSLGDYGWDINSDLPTLIRKLKRIDSTKIRIGLQNLHPIHFMKYQEDFLSFIKNGDIFHLRSGIQSASDTVLKEMDRQYSKQHITEMFDHLVSVGFKDYSTDVIIGFPGETEKNFDETLHFLIDYRPRYVLLSKFLEVNQIPSHLIDQRISDKIKVSRLKRAEQELTSVGIFCSSDGGTWVKDRQKRMQKNKAFHSNR